MAVRSNDADRISRGLQRLRRRRRQVILYLLGVMPVSAVLIAIGWAVLGEEIVAHHWNTWVVWLFLAIWVVLVLRHGFSVCPRCRKLFYVSLVWSNGFSKRCLHCGIEL